MGESIDRAPLFAAYDQLQAERNHKKAVRGVPRNALQAYLHSTTEAKTGTGFQRIQKCREALEALDRQGWQRSFHQRLFHDHFIRACARIFWKTEKPGSFARDHQKILEMNGWDHLSQEILVSTPRRCLFLNFFCSYNLFHSFYAPTAHLADPPLLLLGVYDGPAARTGYLAAPADSDRPKGVERPLDGRVHTPPLQRVQGRFREGKAAQIAVQLLLQSVIVKADPPPPPVLFRYPADVLWADGRGEGMA